MHVPRLIASMLIGVSLLLGAGMKASAVTLDVQIAFDRTTMQAHEEIAKRFMAENPDVQIRFLTPAKNYEDASQQVLRGAFVGQLPDVSYQGLNLLRLLVDRGLAVPLDRFIERDGGEAKLGYQPAMLSVGRQRNALYGIPFAVSTPVLYVNADLVRKAGGDMDNFPKTWEEIVALGKKIDDPKSKRIGFYYQWDITGNWMFQALLFSKGGRMLTEDETKVAFAGPEGAWALQTLEMFARSGMPNLTSAQSRPAFIAGTVGILADSTSNVGKATREIGQSFDFRTVPFPRASEDGRVPAGGNLAVILAKDAAKQDAAWKYVKFATGPVGQTIMVNHTGYMPSNDVAIRDAKMLGDFYRQNPNHKTSIDQIPAMTGWYAFPGPNAVKIIDVIKDHLEAVVTGRKTAQNTLPAMASDVQRLLD